MSSCLLITTHNRSALLNNSLNKLLSGCTLPDEILIVDDGGEDDCEEVCERFSDRLPIRYLYHDNPGVTLCSEARNVGIRNTDADLIITSEPEIVFVSDVVKQMLDGHEERPDVVISAGTVHHEQWTSELMTLQGWVATFCALYEREWLLEIGGWDESFPDPWGWDDTDLLTRLTCIGVNQWIHLGIEVVHQWHISNACDQTRNQAYFDGKGLSNGNRDFLVANKGRAWGQLRTKTI